MKTENLISALVADGASIGMPIAQKVALAIACALALSTSAFFWQLGWRPDIGQARGTPTFVFKFVVTGALLAPAALRRRSTRETRRHSGVVGMGLVDRTAIACRWR